MRVWVVIAAVVARALASAIAVVLLAALPMSWLIGLQVIKQTHLHIAGQKPTSMVRVVVIAIVVFGVIGFCVASKSGFNDLIQPRKPLSHLTRCRKGWRVLLQQFPLNACR